MADPTIFVGERKMKYMLSKAEPEEKALLKELYNYDKERKMYKRIPPSGSSAGKRMGDTMKLNAMFKKYPLPRLSAADTPPPAQQKRRRRKTTAEAPPPAPEPPAQHKRRKRKTTEAPPPPAPEPPAQHKRRRRKTTAEAAPAPPPPSKEAKAVWSKVYTRLAQIEDRSNDYLHGLRQGIMEDKKINKTETPAWVAANRLIKERHSPAEVKAGNQAPKLPELSTEEKNKMRKQIKDKVSKGVKNPRVKDAPAKPRVKVSASDKIAKWDSNWKEFTRGIGLALSNPGYRYEICRYIEGKDEEYQRYAKKKGIDWQHWWKTPRRPNGEKYRQLNRIKTVFDKLKTSKEAEKERAKQLFGK